MPGRAVNPDSSGGEIAARWETSWPQVAVIDNLLTEEALERLRFVPQTVVDTSARHQRCMILGREASAPLVIAPTGLNGLLHALPCHRPGNGLPEFVPGWTAGIAGRLG